MKFKLLLAFVCVAVFARAQDEDATLSHVAPSLQLGLNGLSFTRGNLDAQLIMNIIAEKQEEVKLKLVQSMLLGRLEDSGATVYVFADNIVKNILREKDTELRTRKIIESAVNLSFSAALTKYYLTIGSAPEINLLANTYGINPAGAGPSAYRQTQTTGTARIVTGVTLSFSDDDAMKFFTLMLDLCSEAVRTNPRLKQLGLFNLNYEGSYFNLNKYLELQRLNNSLTLDAPTIATAVAAQNEDNLETLRYLATRQIYSDIQARLDRLVDHIGLLKYAYDYKAYLGSVNDLQLFNEATFIAQFDAALGTAPADYKILRVPVTFQDYLGETIEQLKSIPWSTYASTHEDLKITIEKVSKYVVYLEKLKVMRITDANVPPAFSNVLFQLSNMSADIDKLAYLDINAHRASLTLERSSQILFGYLLNRFNAQVEGELDTSVFLKLISKVYEFDKLSTFSDYMNFLSEVGELLPSDKPRATISTVNSFIQEFTSVTKEPTGKTDENGSPITREVIKFNVESFLVKMKDFKYDRSSPFELLFTVGLNSTNFFKKPVPLTDGESIYNYSFVSEKIGLKLKIFDYQYVNSHNKGETFRYHGRLYTRTSAPRDPVVSNLHLIAYGSGILYNLANVGTSKDFNAPLAGVGAGMTFFNGLDFNASWGVPILKNQHFKKNFDYSYFNIGFDIQFTEYAARLKKQTEERKERKALKEIADKQQQLKLAMIETKK